MDTLLISLIFTSMENSTKTTKNLLNVLSVPIFWQQLLTVCQVVIEVMF